MSNQHALRNICIRITKGTTPTTMGRPFVEEGVNFVKAEALNGDTSLERSSFAFIDEDTHQMLHRSILEKDDVLVTIAGANTGRCGFVTESDLPANANQAVGIVRVDKEAAEPRFVYYFFKLKSTFEYIQTLSAQAAQPNLNLANLGNIQIDLPPKDRQCSIASVLSAYDSLIENNRRRIQLLEQAARLLYREWFVRLRFPGHEHVEIKDGVPEGWKLTNLPDIIAVNPQTPVEKEKEIWYVPMSALSETGMTANTADFERRTRHTNVKFRKNDVLLARITPCLENGKTGFAYFLIDDEVACGSTEFIVLRGKNVSPTFVYSLARSYPFRENAIKSMTGSSGRQRVQVSSFDEYKLVLPPKHLIELFDEIISKNFEQIRVLTEQNDKLIQARDLLLPRLMNGEIAV